MIWILQACHDHFTTHINIKSLCCASETNIKLYVNYISIKKKKKKKVVKMIKMCIYKYKWNEGLEQLGQQEVSSERAAGDLGVKPSASISGPPATTTHREPSHTPQRMNRPVFSWGWSCSNLSKTNPLLPSPPPLFPSPPPHMVCPADLSHSYKQLLCSSGFMFPLCLTWLQLWEPQ